MVLTECPPQLTLCSCGDWDSGNLFPEGRGASTAAWRQLVGLAGSQHCEDGGALHKPSQRAGSRASGHPACSTANSS